MINLDDLRGMVIGVPSPPYELVRRKQERAIKEAGI